MEQNCTRQQPNTSLHLDILCQVFGRVQSKLLDRDLKVDSIKKNITVLCHRLFSTPQNLMCCTEWINSDKLSLLLTTLDIYKNEY